MLYKQFTIPLTRLSYQVAWERDLEISPEAEAGANGALKSTKTSSMLLRLRRDIKHMPGGTWYQSASPIIALMKRKLT